MEAVRAYYLIPSADRLAAGGSFGGGTECREEALRVRTAGRPISIIVIGGLMRGAEMNEHRIEVPLLEVEYDA